MPLRTASSGFTRARSGFTLLEVLVALGIFAMASIVLASAYLNILNGYDIAARGTVTDADLEFARSQVLNEADRTKLEKGGEFDGASGRHVTWSVDIASTNEADLFQVTFTCEITDPARQQSDPQKTVETFTLLRPTWSIDPAEHDKLREDAKRRILELQGKDANGNSPGQSGSQSTQHPSSPTGSNQAQGRKAP